MIKISRENLRALLGIYVASNTPAYLYKRMRAERCVHDLARGYSVSELIALYRKVAAKRRRSLLASTVGYAALIAVTLKDVDEARAALEQLSPYELDWSSAIIGRFLNRVVSNTSAAISARAPAVAEWSVQAFPSKSEQHFAGEEKSWSKLNG